MTGASAELPAGLLNEIVFDARGLVPAIAQQHDTGEVLMVAWMNREAIEESLRTGRACYWSREPTLRIRGYFWVKEVTESSSFSSKRA